MLRWGRTTVALAAGAVAAALIAGCGPAATGGTAAPKPNAPPAKPFTVAITPATGTANAPVSTELGLSGVFGKVTAITLTQAGGGAVGGNMRQDGTSWVPDAPLKYSTAYQANVTGIGADGKSVTRTTSFTTMGQPGNTVGTGLYLQDGTTVGVAMPVVVEFDPPVPDSARAAIQQRLFVSTMPFQPGVWHWDSGRQVEYRAPQYWKPGTVISVRSALQGLPMGDGSYGDTDRSATVTVGQKVVMNVDNATKQMSVYVNDQLARQMPVSLGKPSTPSSSGTMVTMSHDYSTIFDTTREGPGGYRVQVNYAMRLTWGGEFIHAAPWSVGDQGHTNVSHGCVNMSTDNSAWLFGITHIGDPVTVKGTEVQLSLGNGWTGWNQSWGDFVKGSAVPVPAQLAAGTAPPAAAAAPAHPAASPPR
jgi:lipoprotein-anchoring transpeptidase ErfK/SrfK